MSTPPDQIVPPDDVLQFADEPPASEAPRRRTPWKVLVVDDETEIHSLTRLVLEGFTFEERELELLNAYSGKQAMELVAANPDISLILLDVVMEDYDSGLQVVRHIREELGNPFVRIVLRTGQPGQAPEHEVVANYDINDYKAKTELTAQKLFTTVTSALRAYRDLRTIQRHSVGLERILAASASLFGIRTPERFAEVVLSQLRVMLRSASDAVDDAGDEEDGGIGAVVTPQGDGFHVLRGVGLIAAELPESALAELRAAVTAKESRFSKERVVGYLHSQDGRECLLYFESGSRVRSLDLTLVQIFVNHAAVAYHNLMLNAEIVDTQKEVITTLGELVETRSSEVANHVQRVGEYAQLLAILSGLPEAEAELLRLAAPMHDVGKIGIPDAILNKPGPVSADEFEVIKTHTQIGNTILGKSNRRIMQAAAIVAYQHHERWDGTGYPQGLAGERIHIYGRITCLVDVFDALGHRRCYKDAWPLDRVLEFLREGRGSAFDPRLTDLLLDRLEEFLAIQDRLADDAG